jgi:hypothetical protein
MIDGYQTLFNIVIGFAGAMGGWWLNTVWKSVVELQRQLGRMEVLVAGDYVRKDDLTSLVGGMEQRITKKLDQMDAKLDGKVDK